jgi:hypothetical protein
MCAHFWQIIVEFDLDSGGLAQKVKDLDCEINAGRIRVAFQAVERVVFFLKISRTCSEAHPPSCAMCATAVTLGKIGRSLRINIPFNTTS